MEKVRHEQQAIRCIEHGGRMFLPGQQLVKRIESHELQAGLGENLRAGNLPERLLHQSIGAGVAVMIRLAKNLIVPVEQDEIHAPGVRADRDNIPAVFFSSQGQADLDFRPKAKDVPAQGSGQRYTGPFGKR